MKHTRAVLQSLHSKPSVEAMAFADMPEGDANDLGSLALEAYELTDEVYDQLDESEQLENKAERASVLGDFVGAEVSGDDRIATPNEIALIEQATDAVVDGTGEDVTTVIPSLEAFEIAGGAKPALEALQETVSNFIKGAVELVKNAGSSFKKYIKGLFSRLQALKNRISEVEKKAGSATFADSVHVSESQSVAAAWDDNSFVTTFDKAVSGMETIAKKTTEISGPYSQKLLNLHDQFVNLVDETLKNATGRGDKKAVARGDIGKKIQGNISSLAELFQSSFKDGKTFGGLFVSNGTPFKADDNLASASKAIGKSVPTAYRAGNVDGRAFDMTGVTKESVRRLCQVLKVNSGALSRTKVTDSMFLVNFFTENPDLGVASAIFYGLSTTQFHMAINRVNRAYVNAYTKPLMAYINHFFRVAEAQLSIAQKAMK